MLRDPVVDGVLWEHRGGRTVRDGSRVVVTFHGVGRPHDGVGPAEARYWCDADLFRHLIDEVTRVSAEGGRIEITFDDGNKSDLEIAAPLLAERGLAATFFVCAGRLGKPHYLSVEDLAALEAMGMTIGSHGQNHVDLRRVDGDNLAVETAKADRVLAAHCRAPVDSFAIPFGSYDRRALAALRHFRRVYSSDGVRTTGSEHPIPRIAFTRDWSVETITRIVERRDSPVDRARYRAKALLKRMR
jgi:peptidoglycan/xylan/chitin deacetylase (PgdA/CDA1 family)